MSQYVSGQNKAAGQSCFKQINTWYREQTMILEKMNRCQTHTYDRLGRIEREKTQLVSYVGQLKSVAPLESPTRNSQPQKTVGFNETVEEVSAANKGHHLPPLPESAEDEEADKDEGGDVTREGQGSSGRLRGAVSLPSLDQASNDPLPPIPTSSDQGIPVSRSSENILVSQVDQPEQQQAGVNVVFHLTESPPPGARRAPIPAPDSASSSMDPREVYRKAMRDRPATDNNRPSHQNSLAFIKIRRSKSMVAEKRSKSLDKAPWTLYRREPTGAIIPASVQYKRKEFAKPKEKDYALYQTLIRAEEKHTKKTKQRFERLSENLDLLGGYTLVTGQKTRHYTLLLGLF